MDLTEAFAPSQAGGGAGSAIIADEKTTDYFDFVVSPPPHCASADGSTVDEDSFLQRAACRTSIANYLSDTRHLHHDGFIKETNNNTLTALPPVSTITGSLGHIGHHHNHHNRNASRSHGCHLTNSDALTMDQTGQDCDYWVTEDTKEQTCNILLEDLNKYCWTTQATTAANDHHHTGLLIQRRVDSPLGESLQVHHQHRDHCTSDHDRQNTDGAIYTLTVLNSEANSMDGLECCKSPGTPGVVGSDSWSLRPSQLDLDAILNMESSVSIGGSADGADGTLTGDRDHERQQVVITTNGTSVDRYTAQYTTDDQTTAFGVTVKTEPGDNNNDWKLSDRNSLQEAVQVTESAAESLLRNALQGKLYPSAVTSSAAARLLGADVQVGGGAQSNQDEPMQGCADDLLLSQLDVESAYRTTADYDKLKNIANEVVESYCNLEPVCNVSATTVMYTLDPASGSLGTITLPADLASVGTVTVVTTAPPQQDVLQHQDTRLTEPQPQQSPSSARQPASNNLQLPGSSTPTGTGGRAPGTKAPKKYVRRQNRNSANAANSGTGGSSTGNSNKCAPGGAGPPPPGSPGGTCQQQQQQQQRKERSLHYCSICSKGFKDKYSVNVHIRTHTGEKPFACSLCGKSFRQKAHLAKHYQTHVTQKPSVAAAAAAAAQAANATANTSANSTTNNNNNNSNGATSNASSNSGSARGAPSPTAADMQVANSAVVVAQQQHQQHQQHQQQQQQLVEDSEIIAEACNPSS